METGSGTAILWPTIALVGLIYVVWFYMYLLRFAHMKSAPPKPSDFASGAAAQRYFQSVELPGNNLANLFEMPVLYFALVPLLLLTDLASPSQVTLAWGYAAVRAIHSYEHIIRKRIRKRFSWYVLSCALLLAMWIGFAVELLLR